MPGTAVGKYLRVPPRKAKEVLELIKGLPVEKAKEVVRFSKRRAAKFVAKVLNSAVANAGQAKEGGTKSLFVAVAVADTGPILKRVIPRARGVRNLIRKRMSHITITVRER